MLLMNLDPHIDTGYIIAKEKSELYAPVGMLNYSHYKDLDQVKQRIESWSHQLQCIVSNVDGIGAMPFGQAQCTRLSDYADGLDTVQWLLDQTTHT